MISAPSPDEWLALAQDYRESAVRWRKLIKREESFGGRGNSPRWPEMRATLIEMAEGYERDAASALGEAQKLQSGS